MPFVSLLSVFSAFAPFGSALALLAGQSLDRSRGRLRRGAARDAGMSTAEYAVGTIAAAGLAALLYQVLTSDTVSAALQSLVERAFSAPA